MKVDVRLIEYLLGSNPAMLDSLAMTLCTPVGGLGDSEDYLSE